MTEIGDTANPYENHNHQLDYIKQFEESSVDPSIEVVTANIKAICVTNLFTD